LAVKLIGMLTGRKPPPASVSLGLTVELATFGRFGFVSSSFVSAATLKSLICRPKWKPGLQEKSVWPRPTLS